MRTSTEPPASPSGRPATSGPSRSAVAGPVIPVAGWLVGALVYFRDVWRSGFDHLMGNDGDTRLIAYICEHWFRAMHGQGSWRNMPFFTPVKDLLGWSDAFFLYQVLYAPLRELGCGPVLALQLTLIGLSALGFITFYVLVRTWLRAPAPIALAGAGLFTFANNLYLHASTAQLAGIYLIPPVVLTARRAWFWRAARPRRSAGLAAAAGLLWGLVFFTTYYAAAFSAIAFGGALVWSLLLRRRVAWRWLRSAPALPVAAGLGALVLGLLPVAAIYLPAHSSLGGVSYDLVTGYAVSIRGLANVGPGNLFWSSLFRHLHKSLALDSYEGTYALTPLLSLAVIAGGVWLARLLHQRRPTSVTGADMERADVAPAHRATLAPDPPPSRPWAGLILALTAVSIMLLPVKLAGHPPWLALWVLPGFDAIRAIDRVEVMAGAVAALALVAIASEAWAAARARSSRTLGIAVAVGLALIVVEQIDSASVADINRKAQDHLLASVTRAPAGCHWFYVVDRSNPLLPFYESQIDAMFVADRTGVPTVNGYTGYNPAGWNMEEIGAPTYLAAVQSWAAQEHLDSGACHLDLGTMKWGPG
ncbi:MAG TPA: hypothetical protein VG435_00130 [Acidimicrobiales bacterium]|jgi:hypothetical protein|nr:hypothetical protein [Acidimicrobiales bacterium]